MSGEERGETVEIATFTNILAVTPVWFNVRGDHDVPRRHAGFRFQSKPVHAAEKFPSVYTTWRRWPQLGTVMTKHYSADTRQRWLCHRAPLSGRQTFGRCTEQNLRVYHENAIFERGRHKSTRRNVIKLNDSIKRSILLFKTFFDHY